MSELKPCPFCGLTAEMHISEYPIRYEERKKDVPKDARILRVVGYPSGRRYYEFREKGYIPQCSESSCIGRTTRMYKSEKEAAFNWNRRAKTASDDSQLCDENENFIQDKFGYCFYALGSRPLVYNLYVQPQYRRCGHSRVLLKLVISEIRKSGYEGDIHIKADPREGSIGLTDLTRYYQSMGLAVDEDCPPEGSENDG